MPDVIARPYIARQSAIVALRPYTGRLHLESLESAFQRRMVTGDASADAARRIRAAAPQAILIDLVDERRGVWRFPDGSYLTNSVEEFRTGIDEWAPAAGARLIEFGTDEHFDLWRRGFERVAGELRSIGVPMILLDVAWAELHEGQEPQGNIRSFVGTRTRRIRRRYRGMAQSLRQGATLRSAVGRFASIEPTEGELLAATVRKANAEYRRYIAEAERMVTATVRKDPGEVRMDPDHRWGVGPYHYRYADYRDISARIRTVC